MTLQINTMEPNFFKVKQTWKQKTRQPLIFIGSEYFSWLCKLRLVHAVEVRALMGSEILTSDLTGSES